MNSALYDNIISGNVEGVNNCIKNGINIYSRTNGMETALYIAMLHGHGQIAKILWNIYASDLEFIEHTYKTDIRSTFWIDTPILIGFGKKNIETFDALYSKYQKCENDEFINMGKYVMFLLKRDNFKCKKVLMLSPGTREGKMLLLSMIKCVNSNGLLDLNAETPGTRSLLSVSVASGLFNMFDVLLNYGTEIGNIMEIAYYAIEFNRIEFLDELYKRFKFQFYDWLNSNDYYWSIFQSDNWVAFKYVIEKIIAETGLSWNAVLNLTVPFHDTKVKCSALTVFEYAIFERRFQIAENCLKYISYGGGYNKRFCPIELLQLGPESEKLLLKMIEFDPTCLERASNAKLFFYEIVDAMSIGTVSHIYKKYPTIKKTFFKHKGAGQNCIDKLLANGQIEKVRCVLEHSIDDLDMNLLSSIVYKAVETKCDDLFTDIVSMKDFDLASLDTARLITLAVQNLNLDVFNIVMSQSNYDLNEIQSGDKNFNLLHILLHQTCDDNTELISKFFDELIQHDISYRIVCSDGKNLLHYSVEWDNYDVTIKLLRLGIDINSSDEFGKMPVHYARSVKIFELLNTWTTITYENVCTIYEKNTILHLCVAFMCDDDRRDLIEYILDNGGNINATNNEGKTPIYYVHDISTAEIISKYRPELNIVDQKGHSPLINFVADFRHDHRWINLFYDSDKITKMPELRKYLGSRCNEQYDDSTFFIEMIRNCDICTNIMLELQCPDIFTKTNLGNTPLHIAASLKSYDLIDKLVKRGLSLDTRNMEGETPFLLYMRTIPEVGDDGYKRLLKYNPKVDRKSKEGKTSLSFAVRQLNVHTYDLICELLLRGANLLDVYENDRTVYFLEMAYEVQQIFRFAL